MSEIKVGLLYSLTGTTSISEIGQYQATLLAIRQINEKGGIHGKKLVPIIKDTASDPFTAAREAENLIVNDHVIALVGLYTSAARKKVINIIEKYDTILLYPTQYEGEEQHPNVFYFGPLPTQNLIHYIPWLLENLGPKFYLVGSDYIYPTEMNFHIKQLIKKYKGTILGEDYYSLGAKDFSKTLKSLNSLQPDVIFSTLVGESAIAFYKEYYKFGYKSPIASSITAETEIAAIDPKYTFGHYTCFPYFSTVNTTENKSLIKLYKERYGNDVVSSAMENAFNSIHLLAKALNKVDIINTQNLRRAFSGLEYNAPQGKITVDKNNHHLWLNSRIGQVNPKGKFNIIWESEKTIQPIPFSKFSYPNLETGKKLLNRLNSELQEKITNNLSLINELKKETVNIPSVSITFFDKEGTLVSVFNNSDKLTNKYPFFIVGSKLWESDLLRETAPAFVLSTLESTVLNHSGISTNNYISWTTIGIPIQDSNKTLLGVLGVILERNNLFAEYTSNLVLLLETISRYCVKTLEQSDSYVFTYNLLSKLSKFTNYVIIVTENNKVIFYNDEGNLFLKKNEQFVLNLIKEVSNFKSNQILHKKINNNLIEIHVKVEVHQYYFFINTPNNPEKKRLISNHSKTTTKDIIGSNEKFLKSVSLTKAASKTLSNVLLLGESGTGKELFARAIHNESNRKDKPFVAINCAAIPPSLINAELFGYEEGAFTGAKKSGNPGKFEQANGGTIFLDEIGDMPIDLQATLLRVLQEKELTRVGGSKIIPLDVRIIAATNKKINQEIAYKADFRSDLYFRLNVFTIELIPLRERKDDIPELTQYMIQQLSLENNSTIKKGISSEALFKLIEYNWPGNIRELRNIIERSYHISQLLDEIIVEHLPNYIYLNKDSLFINSKDIVKEDQKGITIDHKDQQIISTLLKNKGNISKTAKQLEMSRTTLYKRLDKLKDFIPQI